MTRRQIIPLLTATALVAPLLRAADLSGTWNFVWNTEGGVRRTVWKIRQTEQTLAVDTEGAELAGTWIDGKMNVEGRFHSAEAGYTAILKVSGELEGEQLTGKGAWDQYGLTFTATRA